MKIRTNGGQPTAIYVGNQSITRAYYGSGLIWPETGSIAVEAGTYSITGSDTAFVRALILGAFSAGYDVTGSAMSPKAARYTAANAGAYAATGTTAGLARTRYLLASSTAHAITGSSVTLTVAGGAPTLTHRHTAANTTNGASPSYASVPFGTASSDRGVICAITWAASGAVTLSSATIGGVSAGIVGQAKHNNSSGSAIIIANVTSGTSGTIALTFSSSVLNSQISVWTGTGLNSFTAVDVETNNTTGNGYNPTLTVPDDNSFAIIACGCFVGSTDSSWSGTTERYDTVVESFYHAAFAEAEGLSSGSFSPTWTLTGSPLYPSSVVAVFR